MTVWQWAMVGDGIAAAVGLVLFGWDGMVQGMTDVWGFVERTLRLGLTSLQMGQVRGRGKGPTVPPQGATTSPARCGVCGAPDQVGRCRYCRTKPPSPRRAIPRGQSERLIRDVDGRGHAVTWPITLSDAEALSDSLTVPLLLRPETPARRNPGDRARY